MVALSDEERDRLEEAYRAFGADLWKVIRVYARSREIADDAVVEAFAQAARTLKTIRDEKAWIYRAAFRLATAEMARQRTFESLDRRGSDIPARYNLDEDGQYILDLSARLSPGERAAFILRDVVGCDTRETAQLTGSSESAIRVQLFRARRKLARLLDSGGE
jgi:RNA polymerase sigma-70 factor (ECF subfamily)